MDECECGTHCPPCEECSSPECACTCDGDLENEHYEKPKSTADEGLELFS